MNQSKKHDWVATIREFLLVAGFVMVGYGLWLIWKPIAFVICGSLLIAVGLPERRPKGGD